MQLVMQLHLTVNQTLLMRIPMHLKLNPADGIRRGEREQVAGASRRLRERNGGGSRRRQTNQQQDACACACVRDAKHECDLLESVLNRSVQGSTNAGWRPTYACLGLFTGRLSQKTTRVKAGLYVIRDIWFVKPCTCKPSLSWWADPP